jgi:hypothetical protein
MAPALTPTMACSGTPCRTIFGRPPSCVAPPRPPALSTTPMRTPSFSLERAFCGRAPTSSLDDREAMNATSAALVRP